MELKMWSFQIGVLLNALMMILSHILVSPAISPAIKYATYTNAVIGQVKIELVILQVQIVLALLKHSI